MSQSRLIELSYYDPKAEVRLTAYADTLVLDERPRERAMTAIRFGGYPEMVNAMAAAIHGGAGSGRMSCTGAASLCVLCSKCCQSCAKHTQLYGLVCWRTLSRWRGSCVGCRGSPGGLFRDDITGILSHSKAAQYTDRDSAGWIGGSGHQLASYGERPGIRFGALL